LFGFININKPAGMTSHDVVGYLRKVTHIKQIGHTGTLDPFAQGVLPVAIGKASRLIEYLDDDKEYLATVQLGKTTDTYDCEGEVTQSYDKKITRSELENALTSFQGEIMQMPPVYSAIKVKGKKLYEYARAGQEVKIEPRKVIISKIELQEFNHDNQSAKILIACSKGTYIRSIAYDLGEKLNCGGYLSALTRTKAGRFLIQNSVPLKELKTPEDVEKVLTEPSEVLNFPKYELTDDEKDRVCHGGYIHNKFNFSDIVILVYSGKIYAIGMVDFDRIIVKKVFEVL